jgi:hypothetical protein
MYLRDEITSGTASRGVTDGFVHLIFRGKFTTYQPFLLRHFMLINNYYAKVRPRVECASSI